MNWRNPTRGDWLPGWIINAALVVAFFAFLWFMREAILAL